jgi:hypothetical protein
MSAAPLERLQEHLQRLRLFKVRERLEALLQDATTQETPYADFLDLVLTEEVASKTAKHVTMRTRRPASRSSRASRPSTSAISPRSTRSRSRPSPPATSSSTAKMSSCLVPLVSVRPTWPSGSASKRSSGATACSSPRPPA